MVVYRSDGESDEEDEDQEIPAWAQDVNLRRGIMTQHKMDPDELFQQNEKTCSLDEVFANLGSGELSCTSWIIYLYLPEPFFAINSSKRQLHLTRRGSTECLIIHYFPNFRIFPSTDW